MNGQIIQVTLSNLIIQTYFINIQDYLFNMQNGTSFIILEYLNLSENLLLTVLHTNRELTPSSTSCYQRIHSKRYFMSSKIHS